MADETSMPRAVPRQTAQASAANKDAAQERKERVMKEHDERKAQREENQKKAVEVMEKSTPFPPPDVVDQAKLGVLDLEAVEVPEQPEMPSLHEQRQARRDERKR